MRLQKKGNGTVLTLTAKELHALIGILESFEDMHHHFDLQGYGDSLKLIKNFFKKRREL